MKEERKVQIVGKVVKGKMENLMNFLSSNEAWQISDIYMDLIMTSEEIKQVGKSGNIVRLQWEGKEPLYAVVRRADPYSFQFDHHKYIYSYAFDERMFKALVKKGLIEVVGKYYVSIASNGTDYRREPYFGTLQGAKRYCTRIYGQTALLGEDLIVYDEIGDPVAYKHYGQWSK